MRYNEVKEWSVKCMHSENARRATTCSFCVKGAWVGFPCLWVGSTPTGVCVHYNANEGRVLNWRCYLGYSFCTKMIDIELELTVCICLSFVCRFLLFTDTKLLLLYSCSIPLF